MNNNRSRHQDLETLSAYLDHQLTEAEEQALLGRLSGDRALKEQLNNLRQARYVLRQTPKIKRPRSFVLSPEMVKQQRFAFRMMNVSRWISAVASILLIMAIGGQYLVRGGGFAASPVGQNYAYSAYDAAEAEMVEEPMMAMTAPAEEMQMDDAVEQAVEESAAAAPAAEMEQAAPEEPAAEEPLADEAAEAAELAPQATPTPAGTSEPGGGGGEPPGIGGDSPTAEGDGEILGIGGGPTQTFDEAESRMIPSEKMPAEDADQLVLPADTAGEEEIGEAQLPIAEPSPAITETEGGISFLQIVQALLLVLALAAGLSAVYFRKQVR